MNSPATNCGPLSETNSCGSPYRANRVLRATMAAFAVVLTIGKTSIHLEWLSTTIRNSGPLISVSFAKVQSTKATIIRELPLGIDVPWYKPDKVFLCPLYQGQCQATTQRTWQVLSYGTCLDGTHVTPPISVFEI